MWSERDGPDEPESDERAEQSDMWSERDGPDEPESDERAEQSESSSVVRDGPLRLPTLVPARSSR
jgi:hypothetical protein